MGSLLDNLKGGRTSKPKGRGGSRGKSQGGSSMLGKSRYVAKPKKVISRPGKGKPGKGKP
jgi:hypothetical protein